MSPASSADPHAPATAGSARAAVTVTVTAPDPDGAAAAAAQSPAVHTIELGKRYRTTVALNGLSMTVGRGEVFGFLGPNGAGKTTAVRLLLGLARPTSGEAMVLGAPAGDRETRRKIGYLPELFRYQSWLTAREVLVLHCRLLRLPRPRRGGEVAGALETVGLADAGGRPGRDVLQGHAAAARARRGAAGRPGRSSSWTSPPAPWTRSGGTRSGRSSGSCAAGAPPSS